MQPATQRHGLDFFRLSGPTHPPVIRRSRSEVDSMDDAWQSPLENDPALMPGAVHPLYPGLILDACTATEEIPEVLDGTLTNLGAYLYECQWKGSVDNSKPDKLLSSTEFRTIRQNWETFTEQRLSWHARPKIVTGTASTDTFSCPGHGFSDYRPIAFIALSGSPNITSLTASGLAAVYYVVNKTTDTFQVTDYPGNAVVNITADTSGYVLPVEYLPGIAHFEMTGMFLDTVQLRKTSNDGWHAADCNYIGQRLTKPHHRIISVGGQQFSSSSPIQVIMPAGWTDPRYTNWQLPKVEVIDTVLTTTAPSTATLPAFSTPPNAPPVLSITFWGTELTYNYPYGWCLMKSEMVDSISSAITLHLQRNTYEYVPPIMLR